jgi:hypothetical protein
MIGHHYGLFYAIYNIYILEAISLALYPHSVNKFVLTAPYFMWLWFYLNTFCAEHSQWGALSLTCTEPQWQALHGTPPSRLHARLLPTPVPWTPMPNAHPAVRQPHKGEKQAFGLRRLFIGVCPAPCCVVAS